MFEISELKKEINSLKNDVPKNYEKLLNIYLRLIVEYYYMEKTDEDL
tara:strand:- start:7 stop:147 length:141 start_codon:yes stop_codon:yes gene_type:complete